MTFSRPVQRLLCGMKKTKTRKWGLSAAGQIRTMDADFLPPILVVTHSQSLELAYRALGLSSTDEYMIWAASDDWADVSRSAETTALRREMLKILGLKEKK